MGNISISPEVQLTFNLIIQDLGHAFSFKALKLFTESTRGKPQLIEQEVMPMGVTGYCVALQDFDLIVTRSGMDEILTQTARLHEMSHLLLKHIPRFSYGVKTATYKEFRRQRDLKNAFYRAHATIYDDPREQDAEMLATLLMHAISLEGESLPEFVEDVQGW